MAVEARKQIMTPEEYLKWEAAKHKEEGKSEYYDGMVYDMPGVSDLHDRIKANLIGQFWSNLRNNGYRVTAGSLRNKISTRYLYPDVAGIKGEAKYSPDEFYNLLNPVLIFEILSDSTEYRDMGFKFKAYRQMETLQEYILVSQHEYSVECFYKNEKSDWVISDFLTVPEDVLKFRSVPFQLALKDIYEGVEF